ncbi:hypothetical protein MNBD_GAMMA22-2822 [hydrothermal vent metagenome]|uniref:Rhodanese domain-containing protein n=1 Tax=hydrothermal vent metagenome TaxID=652676 RepID=A0A3B0ZEF0_9ZZZZ
MQLVKEIEINELKTMLDQVKPTVKLIDVRNTAEVARGKIPGSENMPLHTVPLHQESIKEHEKVILYCHSGARSAQACNYLSNLGHENVYNLRGGILAWVNNGNSVG